MLYSEGIAYMAGGGGGKMLVSLLYFRRTFAYIKLLIAHSIEIILARKRDASRYARYDDEDVYTVVRRFFGSELSLAQTFRLLIQIEF